MTLAILDRLNALGDPTRTRLLAALGGQELTVGELCAVLQLPQSTVSRHLRTLADDGWVVSRAEGTSRQYSVAPLDPAARRLWDVVQAEVTASPAARQDRQRLRAVLADRRSRSREFFSSAAGQWDTLRAELFGSRADLALLALLDERWTVGDLGCGTGQIAATLAPFVSRVIAVDDSRQMLKAAKTRLAALDPDTAARVELKQGELESLPIENGTLDAALLFLVLDYAPDPAQVLAEARRVLKPSGRLLIVDLLPHDREDLRQRMGQVWPGFAREQIEEWTMGAGFTRLRYQPLPPDPNAKGPMIFAASATASAATGTN